MTYFIDLRADSNGGNPVANANDVVIRTDTQPYPATRLDADLAAAIQGRDVLLGTHGFHVTRDNGIDYLSHWTRWLDLPPNGVFVGVLWPGDSKWIPFLDYPVEGNEAIKSGQLLADYLKAHFSGAASLSFTSHSLGARVMLETISNLPDSPRLASLTVMAGAIDDTCLVEEYGKAAQKMARVSVLASKCDEVLKWAFPEGNLASGIVTRGDPYWHGALGRYGPNPPNQPSQLYGSPILPDTWDFGHSSYINYVQPSASQRPESSAFAPMPLVVPPEGTPPPPGTGGLAPAATLAIPAMPPGTPSDLNWQQAWAAGFVSGRFE